MHCRLGAGFENLCEIVVGTKSCPQYDNPVYDCKYGILIGLHCLYKSKEHLTFMKMGDLPFTGPSSDVLSVVDEKEGPEIDEQHRRSKNTPNDSNSILLDPVEDFKSHTK